MIDVVAMQSRSSKARADRKEVAAPSPVGPRRLWSRALTERERGLLVVAFGFAFACFDFFAPPGWTWVFQSTPFRVRWFGIAVGLYGLTLVARSFRARRH